MKRLLIPIFVFTIFSWAAFAFLVLNFPPKIEGDLAFSNFFYVLFSGFIGLSLSFFLIVYFLGKMFIGKKRGLEAEIATKKHFVSSLRRGFLFGILAISLTILNVFELFNIFNVILVAGIVALVEIYFSSL